MKNLTEHLPKDMLKWTAAGFALAATATAEYEIAREIGMNQWIAAAVPGALDAYVVRALRSGREVLASVAAMVGVNAASHLVTAGILPVEWPLITAVSAIAPLVLWRVHALGHGKHTAEHTSTEPEHTEHDRAPDNPEVCYCGAEVWGDLGAHQRAPWHPAEHTSTEPMGTWKHPEGCVWGHAECDGERACTAYNREHTTSTLFPRVPEGEHIACTECGVLLPDVPALERHQRWAGHGVLGREHTTSTDQERVRAQTDAWGDDWLDVADAVHEPITPPAPVHAPYVDHVLLPDLPSTRHLSIVHTPSTPPVPEHAPDPPSTRHLSIVHGDEHTGTDPEHAPDPEDWTDPDREHAASTRTADDWNLEHVSTGVLDPEDTEHMERARELFHTIGGVPPFRALKEGNPGMGTPRAKRIRAALKIENEGTD